MLCLEKMFRKLLHFSNNQIKQVKAGGLTVLLKKLFALFLVLLSLPIALLIRLLRPLVVIRFGALQSERIGHFAANVDLYLCQRNSGRQNSRNFDIFYCNDRISNYQLKKMWARVMPIYNLAKWVDKVNRLLPLAKEYTVDLTACRDVKGLIRRSKSHISFTAEEESLGRQGLKAIGVPSGGSFVCFQARDSAYLEATLGKNKNWRYHDYRDSDINNYIPAAEELAGRGHFVVRMGAIVKKRLDTGNPMIVDYATRGRSDFLDIYLGAKCRFFLCDTVGTYAIGEIFRRPILWVNYIPLEYAPSWNENYLFIPKKLWLSAERRFLTFEQILKSGIGRYLSSRQYEQMGIEVIENTPQEISDAAIEMDKRLKGTWQESEEDKQLQKHFWELFKISDLNHIFLSRIGAQFLRQNQELISQDCLL